MLLLVVLSMLILFLMIGTAYVVSTKQSEKAGKNNYKGAVRVSTEEAQAKLLDEVLLQVLRDTKNLGSALRTQSLLADLYGTDGFRATIFNAVWAGDTSPTPSANGGLTGGQMIQFAIDTSNAADLVDLYGIKILNAPPNTPPQQVLNLQAQYFSPLDDAYNGQLITFINGPVAGQSVRIVGYRPPNVAAGTPATFTVMTPTLPDGSPLTDPTTLNAAGNSLPVRIVVNGRPFSGTGVGFNPQSLSQANPSTPKLNLAESVGGVPQLTALLPNAQTFLDVTQPSNALPAFLRNFLSPSQQGQSLSQNQQISLAWQIGPAGIGGANESYDAVDFQNMALALLPPNPIESVPFGSTTLSAGNGAMILPSFHRPALINYWKSLLIPNGPAQPQFNAALLRRVLLRPNWIDHPGFTGSNPEFAMALAAWNANQTDTQVMNQLLGQMIYGPWDVDNDNDGVRDSVWVDFGAPVMTLPNGKRVRPLAAVLCVDLDGRLNVNAHTTIDLANFKNINQPIDSGHSNLPIRLADGSANATVPSRMPRGAGWGPADISLVPVLDPNSLNNNSPPQNTQWILTGNTFPGDPQPFPGRYGFIENNASLPTPGRAAWADFLTQIGLSGWPDRSSQFALTKFALPPDLRARYGIGLNAFGQPIFQATLQSEIADPNGPLVTDSPYELNLSRSAVSGVTGSTTTSWSPDMPYSLAELERVLRVYDADVGKLPTRLAYLAGIQGPGLSQGNLTAARQLTTDSFDLPAPNVELPPVMNNSTFINTQVPANIRLPRSTAELIEIRVRYSLFKGMAQAKFPIPLTGDLNKNRIADATEVNNVVRQLLAPELADGLRLNINRPLGNGLDDNQDGTVDEPTIFVDKNGDADIDGLNELLSEETQVWHLDSTNPAVAAAGPGSKPYQQATALAPNPTAPVFPPVAQVPSRLDQSGRPLKIGVDASGQVQVDQEGRYLQSVDHRQLLARHLYVMALTLTADATYANPLNNDQQKADDAELARRTAQWAANAIDFRDADNDMTAFEYDVNPFDGWDVDGVIGFNSPDDGNKVFRGVVWGAERPELLMTETLAWHDRRTDNTASAEVYRSPSGGSQGANNQDTIMNKQNPQDPKSDRDYDSLTRPKGAFFLELYNPWPSTPGANGAPGMAGSLHRIAISGQQRVDMGVDLAAVSQPWRLNNQNIGASPVWRLAIYKRPNTVPEDQAYLWDPDDTDQIKTQKGFPKSMDRSVYLAGFDPQFPDDGVAFFNDPRRNPVPPVRPGRYMVIGSGDEKSPGVYEAPLGDRKGARNPATANRNKLRCVQLVTRRADPNPLHSVAMLDAMHTAGNQDAPQSAISDITVQGMYRTMAPTEASMIGSNPPIGDRAYPGDTSNCVADVAIIDQVSDGSANGRIRRRLTLSEPAIGYPNKYRGSIWNEDKEQYQSADNTVLGIDVPLDGPIGGEQALQQQFPGGPRNWPTYLTKGNGASQTSAVDPVLCQMRDSNTGANGGTPTDPGASYAFIYLQRLANPRLPYNPEPGKQGHDATRPVNPYLTVDTTSANLTVFNSRGDAQGLEEDGYDSNKAGTQFTSHERGYTQLNQFTSQDPKAAFPSQPPSIWSEELPSGVRSRPSKLKIPLLKTPYNNFYPNPQRPPNLPQMQLADRDAFWFNRVPFSTLGYMNRPFDAAKRQNLTGEQRQVVPNTPFSWLAWNNRPYLSGKELLLVPRTRSSQLLKQFFTAEPVTGNKTHPSSYQKELVSEFIKPQPTQDQQPAFTYLENFFYERPASQPTQPNRQVPSALYRLFEYVHTPSLFAGTSTWLNPSNNTANNTGFGSPLNPMAMAAPYDPRLNRQPPFNSISEFRDPGQVNLNTITGTSSRSQRATVNEVYSGLFHGAPTPNANPPVHPGPPWGGIAPNGVSLLDSRRGYGANGASEMLLDRAMPTLFANPFRSPDAGDLVPLQSMIRSGVDCTLLRSVQGTPPGNGPAQASGDPMFAATTIAPYNQFTRSASFRYGPMIRLDNLTTTRSNVYAVWVTIGFFEVEQVAPWGTSNPQQIPSQAMYNRVYPDGYSLGREAGLDTGDNRRLRGFYIIDRSMPAGFEPGSDLNVENTIRLKRRIQ